MIDITDENLGSYVRRNMKAIIDVYGTFCGPCREMEPTLEAAAKAHPDIGFGKVNVQKNPKINAAYKISAVPTLLYFKNGHIVGASLGRVDEYKLEQLILDYLGGD